MAKYIIPTLISAFTMTLLSGCVTQSFENNEPIVKTQANRDQMAATRVSLGLGYLRMGDMSQAKLNLEKAKQFSPELVQVHTAFAHYYETVDESKLAIESFEKALAIKADSADTLNNYGVFLCRQKKVAAAEVQFLKAIAVPSYLLVSQSYENLSSCYLQIDDFEKAEMYLNKAIFHSPNRTATLLQMVRLQYAMGNYKESKYFLQKFERNTQRFTAASLALAYKLYWKLGQRRTASNYANMLVKMYPQSWEAKQYLLNELEFIEPDELAKKYQRIQKEKNRQYSPAKNKRVVKLSPKKNDNTLFTNSIKTAVPTIKTNEINKNLTTSTAVKNSAVMSPQQISATSSPVLSAGTALVDSTVAIVAKGAAADKTALPASESLASNTQNTALIKNDNEQLPAVASATVVIDSQEPKVAEPTSTQPVAAMRDVPLPEALPEPVEVDVIIVEAAVEKTVVEVAAVEVAAVEVTAKEPVTADESVNTVIIDEQPVIDASDINANDIEIIDAQDAIHTVIKGDNLYNISVKYNVKLKTIRKWNGIDEKNKIRIGDKLYVVDPKTVKKINE